MRAGSRTLIEVGISTAFGCTIQGAVEPAEVLRLVQAVLDAGVDTRGPGRHRGLCRSRRWCGALFEQVLPWPATSSTAATSTTRAAWAWPTSTPRCSWASRRFDACLGGIGGCPHAPGASGNVATEDLAYMLASMGIETGQDFDALLALRAQGRAAGWKARPCTARSGAPACPRPCAREAGRRMSTDATTPHRSRCTGLRVIEFTHMVMGPTCGMVLADLGAEVIKVEPVDGDRTRRLLGAGAGFFPMFNRNKKSIGIDLHSAQGAEVARRCAPRPTWWRRTSSRARWPSTAWTTRRCRRSNPRLIYVSHKGFLPGPYDHRTALDEVVQMMGGLAYMTGRPGDPLRAGTSVNDIMGGLFGAIGVLGALIQRGITGRGMEVQSRAVREQRVPDGPAHAAVRHDGQARRRRMPARDNPWAVYDVFTVKDGEQIFLAAVSDAQWMTFCDALGFADLKAEPGLATNNQRVRAAPAPAARRCASAWRTAAPTSWPQLMEKAGLPFAPIRKPEDLYDDEHLLATGGLADVRLPDGPQGRRDREDHAVPDHDGRPAPGRAAGSAAPGRAQPRAAGTALGYSRRARSTSCVAQAVVA